MKILQGMNHLTPKSKYKNSNKILRKLTGLELSKTFIRLK